MFPRPPSTATVQDNVPKVVGGHSTRRCTASTSLLCHAPDSRPCPSPFGIAVAGRTKSWPQHAKKGSLRQPLDGAIEGHFGSDKASPVWKEASASKGRRHRQPPPCHADAETSSARSGGLFRGTSLLRTPLTETKAYCFLLLPTTGAQRTDTASHAVGFDRAERRGVTSFSTTSNGARILKKFRRSKLLEATPPSSPNLQPAKGCERQPCALRDTSHVTPPSSSTTTFDRTPPRTRPYRTLQRPA